MISLDKLAQVYTILVHDSCADGTASAILLQDAFYGSARRKVRFLQHGSVEMANLQPEPGMLFCDFSPPADRVEEFVRAGAIVLDHHRTAANVVAAFGENGVFGDERDEPGVCGAVLAYRHVWKPLRGELVIQDEFARWLSRMVGIRDTWQRQDADWEAACIVSNTLGFIPNERWMGMELRDIASRWNRDFQMIGQILHERNQQRTSKSVESAYRFTTQAGTRVVMFDGLKASSDAAELLGEEADLVVGFMPTCSEGTPKYIYSTRSHTTFDCAAFSKAHGGGGHTRAAGFNVPINPQTTPNPYVFLANLLETYETVVLGR